MIDRASGNGPFDFSMLEFNDIVRVLYYKVYIPKLSIDPGTPGWMTMPKVVIGKSVQKMSAIHPVLSDGPLNLSAKRFKASQGLATMSDFCRKPVHLDT